MAKRSSSIRGRGAEILLGQPTPADIEPQISEQPPVEAEPPEPDPIDLDLETTLFSDESDQPRPTSSPEGKLAELDLEDALFADESDQPPPTWTSEPEPLDDDLIQALFEEALDGVPGPGREEDLSVLEEEPPPTPEMEVAFIEEAVVAEEPPEPVAEEPTPTLEVTMEEQDLSEEAAIYEPPLPETSDVTSGVLPPKPSRAVFDMDIEPTPYDIQEPEEKVAPLELPDRELTEEEWAQILVWMGEERLQKLEQEIDEAYREVRRKIGENEDISTECYNRLLKARDIVLRRDAARFAQAEYYVELVHARLKRAEDSERAAKKYQWRILLWGLIWCTVYLAVLLLLGQGWVQEAMAPAEPGTGSGWVDMPIFLASMIWGGIGGVVAVLYSLFKHVGRRDFDTQYNISYIGKPFLGLILGATIYMVFNLVLRTLGLTPAGLQGTETSSLTVAPGVMYLMAWACGFKENRIFDLVDRVMKRIFSGEEATEEPPPPEPAGEPEEPLS